VTAFFIFRALSLSLHKREDRLRLGVKKE